MRLTLSCQDQLGIVATVSAAIRDAGAWITEANQYADPITQRFFMRYEFKWVESGGRLDVLTASLESIAERFEMTWQLVNPCIKKRVLIMLSKESHCLLDLLHRWHGGQLNAEVVGVISNHPEHEQLASWYQVPFHCIPCEAERRSWHFERVERLWDDMDVDLVVLARYMQIIPTPLCERYFGRVVNIHHSFLPSFIGASPYRQAHRRGVKLIGATCHYVTAELDEGPIIEQDVVRVDHSHTLDEMIQMGQDVERLVLAGGVLAHLEDRVLIDGNKTVVFK